MQRKIVLSIILCFILFSSCKKGIDFPGAKGNPQLQSVTVPQQAYFGDSIPFSANVSDAEVALSTLKAQLFYGEDMVAETTLRTRVAGNYSGKIFAPFLKNIPNGTATLKLVLQNIHFTKVEEEHSVALSRPQYQYVTLITEVGDSIRLLHAADNMYAVASSASAPQMLRGYIVAPAYGANGNPISFGWGDGTVIENTVSPITFLSLQQSPYNISFNTLTYERSPFASYSLNGKPMNFGSDGNFSIDLDLTKGSQLVFDGIQDMNAYWIDPDFLTKDATGKITFAAVNGKYRVIADRAKKYFRIQVLNNSGQKATLQNDGSGAIWIAGWGIAKPGMSNGQPGWNPGNMLCMAPVEPKIYRMTVVASGEKESGQIRSDYIDFKFFHQDDWGGEYKGADYASATGIIPDVITLQESGNIGLTSGKQLVNGKTYVITIDCTEGKANPKLSIVEK